MNAVMKTIENIIVGQKSFITFEKINSKGEK